MTMTLVEPRGPKVTGWPDSGLIVVAGEPKSGKTKFVASMPDSYLLELDKKDADRVGGRIHDVNGMDEFSEILQMVIAEPSIKVIGIDTVDTLGQWMEAEIAKKYGLDFLGQTEKGKADGRTTWGELAMNIRGLTDYIKHCGKLVVLIAHTKDPEKDDQGRITKPAGIKVRGAGSDYIIEQAEAIGHMRVKVLNDKPVHYLSFKAPSDQAIWRSRIAELQGREFIIQEADPFTSFYAAAFEQKEAARAPVALKPAVNGTVKAVATNGNGHKPAAKAKR